MLSHKATFLGIFLDNGRKSFHWHIDLRNGAESYQFTYRAGMAHCKNNDPRFPVHPDLSTIMQCMECDFSCPHDFDEYCDEFGWPKNKAEHKATQATCLALKEQHDAMIRLFGADAGAYLSAFREE